MPARDPDPDPLREARPGSGLLWPAARVSLNLLLIAAGVVLVALVTAELRLVVVPVLVALLLKGAILVVILLFFCVHDGLRIWGWVVDLFPRAAARPGDHRPGRGDDPRRGDRNAPGRPRRRVDLGGDRPSAQRVRGIRLERPGTVGGGGDDGVVGGANDARTELVGDVSEELGDAAGVLLVEV